MKEELKALKNIKLRLHGKLPKNTDVVDNDLFVLERKLGQLEDILDKYGFETIEDLDNFLDSCKRRIECERSN